jgi:putative transposase
MITYKSYKFRLTPAKEQIPLLLQHSGNLRFLWNKLWEYANNFKKENDRFPTKKQLRSQLALLKNNNDFLTISHSQPMQATSDKLVETIIKALKPEKVSLRNQEVALAHKKLEKAVSTKVVKDIEIATHKLQKAYEYAFPKFKKKSDNSDSIFYPQFFKIKKSRICFPKLGWINYKRHRKIEGIPKFLTITQDGKLWFVSITSEVEIKEKIMKPINEANIVGGDVGLTTYMTLSDGNEIENPRHLRKYLKKLKKESKKLSKKELKETNKKTDYGKVIKQSSKNRDKQIFVVQKVHRKIRNVRKDFLHKTSHYLITKYDGIVLEDLDIKNLLRVNGKAMNRSICDASWYELARQLDYKSKWNSKYFIKTEKYDPSTQECNKCHNKQRLSLKQRVYICPKCGHICGRDLNASKNIRDKGIIKLKENYNTVATTGIKVCGSFREKWVETEKVVIPIAL